MVVGIVTDVLEMLHNGTANLYTAHTQPQLLAEDLCVVAGAAGGAKAGHGHSNHTFGAFTQQFHGLGSHQQCQRRVQSAGNTDDGSSGIDMTQSAGQSLTLQTENVGAVFIACSFTGQPGVARDNAGQCRFFLLHGEKDVGDGIAAGITVDLSSVDHQLLYIDFRNRQRRLCKGGTFRQHCTVFSDQLMTGKHHVGRTFTDTGVAQYVSAVAAAAVSLHQRADGAGMTGCIVAGAKVGNDGSTVAAHFHRGRHGNPKILTNLQTNGKIGRFVTLEQHSCTKRHIAAAQENRRNLLRCRCKPAKLSKFIVVGQIGLGNYTQNLAAIKQCSAVIQLAQMTERQANGQQQGQGSGTLQQSRQGLHSAVLQALLEE